MQILDLNGAVDDVDSSIGLRDAPPIIQQQATRPQRRRHLHVVLSRATLARALWPAQVRHHIAHAQRRPTGPQLPIFRRQRQVQIPFQANVLTAENQVETSPRIATEDFANSAYLRRAMLRTQTFQMDLAIGHPHASARILKQIGKMLVSTAATQALNDQLDPIVLGRVGQRSHRVNMQLDVHTAGGLVILKRGPQRVG